ncbi:MAG TPA: hypothetical protein P5186_28575 [Candidatus Paceibacterota bacterium]|nr:hypothetical protein [Verrucomicrobiota bacterium]HRY52004.1 hypothetical protein [Candidatus Paceibacterota bacterium]HSA02653.1 hypothetical protein [Candidatus Paceibacterota bacterium]
MKLTRFFSLSHGLKISPSPIRQGQSAGLLLVEVLFFLSFTATAAAPQGASIVGRWRYAGPQLEIIADFHTNGSFSQITADLNGRQEFQGQYRLNGSALLIHPTGYPAQQIDCRFQDADTLVLSYPTGEVIQAVRVQPLSSKPGATKPEISPREAPSTASRPTEPTAQTEKTRLTLRQSPSGKPGRLVLQRIWEPNERAFTTLVPKGWKVAGGIFNVNPLQMNGPGNSISPKCDFAVKNNDRGSVMLRWMPGWNHADLTFSPTGFGLFQPGQYYQGMLVQVMPSPKAFLIDLLRKERPRTSDLRIVAEDPMPEVTRAFEQQAASLNLQLRQAGLGPLRFDSLALAVEYTEGDVCYREVLSTTIADNRASAFQWSNENTVMFRAPAAEFDAWKPVLDMIQSSREANPQWLAAVVKAIGERAKAALETQQYINKVSAQIVENRRRTHAEIQHENWLFLTGQEEYKNPFTGAIERGTSEYRYRWQNNQGEMIYTDENAFDPNRIEEFNTKEWKRSEIWDRKK